MIILRSCALTVLSRPVRFPLRAWVPQPEKHGLSVCPDKIAPLVHLTPEVQLAGNAGRSAVSRVLAGPSGGCSGSPARVLAATECLSSACSVNSARVYLSFSSDSSVP